MRKIKIDGEKFKNEEGQEVNYRQLIEEYQEVFARARIKHVELKKKEVSIIDFLPPEEREKYWSIREYYTGRELL